MSVVLLLWLVREAGRGEGKNRVGLLGVARTSKRLSHLCDFFALGCVMEVLRDETCSF